MRKPRLNAQELREYRRLVAQEDWAQLSEAERAERTQKQSEGMRRHWAQLSEAERQAITAKRIATMKANKEKKRGTSTRSR